MTQKFRAKTDGISWREVDDEVVILDLETSKYLSLNGSAAVLWLALQKPVGVDGLAAELASRFELDEATARTDAEAFVEDCRGRDLIEAA